MAIKIKHNNTEFGVGDKIRVVQTIKEGEKSRLQAFEGIVIKIKGREEMKTFTVRRIGAQQVGIERIFPLNSPVINKIEVVKSGVRGTRRAKLYYIRDKSRKEIEAIYSRASKKTTKKGASKKSSKLEKKK